MARHTFSFLGGEDLTTMGATWFVSYAYYKYVDSSHKNWEKVSTANSRASVFNSTNQYHKYWLEQVLNMNDFNLAKNSIGLSAFEVKNMAKVILDTF